MKTADLSDPGLGRKDAEPGTEDWAKAWRLSFQSAVDGATFDVGHVMRMVEIGKQHRAWTLLNKKDGSLFKRFDEFVQYEKPWGLSMHYDKFMAMLEAAIGKQAAQLIAVPEPQQGSRSDLTSRTECVKLTRNEQKIAAINRAPEIVQELYRGGLINQVEAARLGKKDADRATVAAELSRAAEETKSLEPKERRKVINSVAKEVSGLKEPTPVERLSRSWKSIDEEQQFDALKVLIDNATPTAKTALRVWLMEEGD